MAQGFRQNVRIETGTQLRVDPRVVLASQVLQLTQHELEQLIETELQENPALERLQDDHEPIDEESILRTVAPQELRPGSEDQEFRRSLPNDEQLDWLDLASSTTSLWEHLQASLLPGLPEGLKECGAYMIGCVNEKGYLDSPLEEIALQTGVSLEQAEQVLKVLQGCEPAGVGARDIRECLLLQLRNSETIEEQLARAILKTMMDEFVGRRVNRICRRFRVVPELVEAAFAEILALNPFPGEGFTVSRCTVRESRSMGVVPDLVLKHSEQGWEIDVRGSDPMSLAVSRGYQVRFAKAQAGERVDPDEKRHVSTYVNRARDFLTAMQQRRKTLRRIGEYLVEHQGSFVSTGSYQFLRPLTRSNMAKDLGLHESTISRATMGKFVQICNSEVISFDVFFKPALRVQKMIEEILANENPENPLSDETIAQMLAKRGVTVARRTVNKYRDRTKLLSSRKRRSA